MKTSFKDAAPGPTDLRFEIAREILIGWKLGEIVEQPHGPDGVARLALDYADELVKGAIGRGWIDASAAE